MTSRILHTSTGAQESESQILTISEAAAFLRVSETDVFALVKSKAIPFIQIGDTYRFYLPALHDWMMGNSGQRVYIDESSETDIKKVSFGQFVEVYLRFVKENRSPKTLENAERVMKLASVSFGNIRIGELNKEHVSKYVEERRKTVSGATVSIDVRTLKAAMQLAVEWEYLTENPFKKFKTPHQVRKTVKFISHTELEGLLSVVKEDYLRRLFMFAVLTCMRRNEIIYLKWEDVDLERKLIYVHPAGDHRTKFNKERSIPVTPQTGDLLNSIDRSSPYIFVNEKGKRLLEDFVTKKFKAYCREIGLDESIHFHSLRKTGATWAAANGATPLALRELLGHSSIKTTEIYLGVPAESVRDAAEKITLKLPQL
jgi:integrase/recombinase XerD